MLADSANPGDSAVHESQSSMTTHEPTDDIENLKAGQLANCESIRSLAQSVSHIASVISQFQKRNEGIYNKDISEHEEVPLEGVKQAEHANHANSEDPIVLTQLIISSENNIEECTPSLKENAFDLSYDENLNINLNACDTDTINSGLNHEQKKVFDLAAEGHNVFFGGQGGTGKTFTVKRLVSYLSATKNVAVTCTTGMACDLYEKASTLHAFAGIVNSRMNVYELIVCV
ncbi:ATP-dependent DNA helicase PIF1 [Paramuricea clavata]|uniref:ATP-dependent DNA helicase n=1 Tax=Paramuricea clavata TaxID=317549 RepID=A0A7D9M2H9_PARCT|nr:ATP-dependent DNA helicase PIF1 [Paramuricea clavata]